MKYKNAWKCQKCPQSNDEKGCPCWTELMETNVQTGQERITKKCLFQLMPNLLVQVIKAGNRPAAEISAMRGEVLNNMQQLTQVVARQLPNSLSDPLLENNKKEKP